MSLVKTTDVSTQLLKHTYFPNAVVLKCYLKTLKTTSDTYIKIGRTAMNPESGIERMNLWRIEQSLFVLISNNTRLLVRENIKTTSE